MQSNARPLGASLVSRSVTVAFTQLLLRVATTCSKMTLLLTWLPRKLGSGCRKWHPERRSQRLHRVVGNYKHLGCCCHRNERSMRATLVVDVVDRHARLPETHSVLPPIVPQWLRQQIQSSQCGGNPSDQTKKQQNLLILIQAIKHSNNGRQGSNRRNATCELTSNSIV